MNILPVRVRLIVLLFTLIPLYPGCNRPAAVLEAAGSVLPVPAPSLVVFTYPEYLAPEALEQFQSENGIPVTYEVFNTTEEMRAKLESNPGHYDLVIADEGTCQDLRHLKLIQSFDPAKLSGLDLIDPRFANPARLAHAPSFIPYLTGTTIMAYRADKLELTPDQRSWSLFWDARVKGKAAFTSEPVDVLAVGLASQGFPLHSRQPEHHVQAIDRIRHAIRDNGVQLGDSWNNLERLASGELWLAHCYSGDAAFFAAENESIRYLMPREGAEIWVDGFLLARDSNRVEAAHLFVSFMLRPEVAVQCANFTRYLTPNTAAMPLLDADLRADEALNPPAEMLEKCSVVPNMDDLSWLQQVQFATREIHEARQPEETSVLKAPSAPLLPVGGIE